MASEVKLPTYCEVVMLILLQALNVKGQAGFPSGTTINCYGSDSACTNLQTNHTLDYGDPGFFSTRTYRQAFNPCCFAQCVPAVVTPGYYSVGSDGTCQSCTDSNVQFNLGFHDISCYNSDNPTCSGAPAETDQSVRDRAVPNTCCGGFFNLAYYNATVQGECLPCNPTQTVDPPTQGNGGSSNLSSMLIVLLMVACSMMMLSL